MPAGLPPTTHTHLLHQVKAVLWGSLGSPRLSVHLHKMSVLALLNVPKESSVEQSPSGSFTEEADIVPWAWLVSCGPLVT